MPYAVVEKPDVLPGCCKVCGSGDKPWYLDTGTLEEFWGAVYYCSDCMADIARVCGFSTAEDTVVANRKVAELGIENTRLRSELVALEKIVDGYRDLGSSRLSHPASNPFGVDVPAPVEVAESGPSGEGETVGTGTGETPEPGDVEGVGDLRTDAVQSPDFSFKL